MIFKRKPKDPKDPRANKTKGHVTSEERTQAKKKGDKK